MRLVVAHRSRRSAAPVRRARGRAVLRRRAASASLSQDGKHRFVAVPTGTRRAIERVAVHGGAVSGWATLDGAYGIPQPTMRPGLLEGLTRDGKQLLVGSVGLQSPTRFAVVDTRNLARRDRFAIPGSFAYDALSPDGKTLYLTQYVDRDNASRYVVRAYDLEHGRLLPGRIADKAQASWVMEGFATTRTTSGDGRWVYTLFMRPGGYPFVHALDTVRGVAHCIGLPWTARDQAPLMGMRMTLATAGASSRSTGRAAKRGSRSTPALAASRIRRRGGFPWTHALQSRLRRPARARARARSPPPSPAHTRRRCRSRCSLPRVELRARPRRRRGADGRRHRAGRRRVRPPRVAARSVPRRDRARARGDAQEPRAARGEGRRAGRRRARARDAGRRPRRRRPDDRGGRRGRSREARRLPSAPTACCTPRRSSRRTRRRSRSRRWRRRRSVRSA